MSSEYYQILLAPFFWSGQEMFEFIIKKILPCRKSFLLRNPVRYQIPSLVKKVIEKSKQDLQESDGELLYGLNKAQRINMFDSLVETFPDVKYQKYKFDKSLNIVISKKTGLPILIDPNNWSVFCLSAMYLCKELSELKQIGNREDKFRWYSGIAKRTVTEREVYAALGTRLPAIYFPELIEQSSGNLNITIKNLNIEKVNFIKNKINDANIGCFVVGKKGLAYLNEIRVS